ncbi:Putative ribonuclease H protein At1g65750 [Linum perenne]
MIIGWGTGRVWNIPLSIMLRGGALEEWNQLIHWLESLPGQLITSGPAYVVWPLHASGRFTVKSLRSFMTAERFEVWPDFPKGVVWSKMVPTKIQGFLWMVWHGKIASIDNLQKRGMVLTNWCVLCEKNLESIDHMFLHCPFATSVWGWVSSKLSLIGPRNASMRGLIEAWKGMNCTSRFSAASKVVLHGFCWFIWLERNARIFNEDRMCEKQVGLRILCNTGRWLSAAGVFSPSDLTLWSSFIFDPG